MEGILGGVGYYDLQFYFSGDPCANWDWYQAAFWGGAGAVLGAAIGTLIYGGWWVGVQAGWWGKTVVDYVSAGGDPSDEIAEVANTFGKLRQAQEFGIQEASQLKNAIAGKGLQVHHLIELRFTAALGKTTEQARQWLSIAVTPEEHQIFTNAWRTAIGYNNQMMEWTTNNVNPTIIWIKAQEIYADYPALLDAVKKIIFGE